MKIIFLDIDGVLNSIAYEREKAPEQSFIDESRLPLVAQIVRKTGAAIVLSSTWRIYWKEDISECNNIGRELHSNFDKYHLDIYDTTGSEKQMRPNEIKSWLESHADIVSNYVILDDTFAGWSDMAEHLVKTDYRIGRGLEEVHVRRAIEILNN